MKSIMATVLLAAFFLAGCSGLTLVPVDFSWPMEIRPDVDAKGSISDDRYGLSFNIKPLLFAETGDSVKVAGTALRIIRDHAGYYYITAPNFKNVYLFSTSDGKLKLENKIEISQTPMSAPTFNQRKTYIQLVNGNAKPFMLTKEGKTEGGEKK